MASILLVLLCTPFYLTHYLINIICCLLPQGRPLPKWSVNQAVRVRTVRLLLLYWSLLRAGDRLKLKPGREKNRWETIAPKSKNLYKGPLAGDPAITPATIGATWTPARPPPARIVSSRVTVDLHFHGGGFAIGDGRDADAGWLARTLVRHMGCTHVCSVQYRLSSSSSSNGNIPGHFPAPLQDALTAYLHLVRDLGIPAEQIVVSGDSAGGNMVLGLLRYVADFGAALDIPAPAAAALWSPWTDVGAALDADLDITQSPNYPTDYLSEAFARWGASSVTARGAVDAKGPYLSPLHHPFTMGGGGVKVPVFVNGGSAEVLFDDIKAFCKAYGDLGWDVHLDVSEGCPHDILLLGPRMGFHREAEAAARNARAFFSRVTDLHLEKPYIH